MQLDNQLPAQTKPADSTKNLNNQPTNQPSLWSDDNDEGTTFPIPPSDLEAYQTREITEKETFRHIIVLSRQHRYA